MEDLSGDELPLSPADLRIDTQVVSLELLLQKLSDGELLLPPAESAPTPWSTDTASLFLESLLARIPTPDLYLDATHEEHWTVIDGARRLSTLKAFVLDKAVTLDALVLLPELRGMPFSKLPRGQSRRIEEAQVTVHLVEKGTPPALTLSIYKRLHRERSTAALLAARHAGTGWTRAKTLSEALNLEALGLLEPFPLPVLLRVVAAALAAQSPPPQVRNMDERLDWALLELAALPAEGFGALQEVLRTSLLRLSTLMTEPIRANVLASPPRLEAWVAALVRKSRATSASEAGASAPSEAPEADAESPAIAASLTLDARVAALDQDAAFLQATQERTASEASLRVRVAAIDALLTPVAPG